MSDFIGAFDQSTFGTRFAVLDANGTEVAARSMEHAQRYPEPGWVEHQAPEIWAQARDVMAGTLCDAGLAMKDLASIGITNQIETTLVWNRHTGEPYYNAIVWQDTRTDQLAARLVTDGHAEMIHSKTGLVPNPHFSATKIQWLLDHVDGLRAAAERGDALFGGMDTWLVWQLTGGVAGGRHVTDVTNASRTMLMDLATLNWDEELLGLFGIPRVILPEIHPSACPDGFGVTTQAAVPIGGVIGEPQAGLFGNGCFAAGEVWSNYADRNLVLLNVGAEPVRSTHGLHTTLAYQLYGNPPVYALEGKLLATGGAARWVVNDLYLGTPPGGADFETLAAAAADTGGLYFIPAFTGLGAPDPRPNARAAVVGLTLDHNRNHLARAVLESVGYRMSDVLAAMTKDSGVTPRVLRVDGPESRSDTCLAVQADVLGLPVNRATTSHPPILGAAYAAGLGVGYWTGLDELAARRPTGDHWTPRWDADRRRTGHADWHRALDRAEAPTFVG